MANERRLDLRVANLDCENEAATIVRKFKGIRGVLDVAVNASAARVTFRIDEQAISVDAVAATLRDAGFPPRTPNAEGLPAPWRNAKVVASAISGLLLLAGWLASSKAPPRVVVGVYVASLAVGGYFFAREAVEDLVREREIGIELLMTLAAVVATVMGEPGEGAMLAFLYSISEAAEGYTAEKTRAAVRALMKLAPQTAIVRREGKEIEIPVEDIEVGEIFLARPGQSIATDGEILVTPIYRPLELVRISPEADAFVDGTTITLSHERSDVDIRYTLDGSDPSDTSPRYAGPLVLRETTWVKARAFRRGMAAEQITPDGV